MQITLLIAYLLGSNSFDFCTQEFCGWYVADRRVHNFGTVYTIIEFFTVTTNQFSLSQDDGCKRAKYYEKVGFKTAVAARFF